VLGSRPLPRRLDQRKLVLSPDEECLVPPLRRLVGREQPESRHWPRLALEGKRLDRFHRNGATNKRQRWFSEQYLPRLSRLLQPGGDVDRIPGCKALLGPGDDLARHDADAAFDSKLGQRLAHLDGRPTGTEGVVLVREWDAEDRHDRVADEFLDRAAVSLDDLLHPLEVTGKQSAQRLRISCLPQRRRSDYVAEEDRDRLPLLLTARRRRCPALRAKLESLRGLVAANSTSGH